MDGGGGVPVVGGGDEDGVDVFLLEKLAVVAEALGVGVLGLELVDFGSVDIADGGEVNLFGAGEDGRNVFASITAANQAEVDAFVSAENSSVRGSGEHGCAAISKSSPSH